jgi:hypothetical protein
MAAVKLLLGCWLLLNGVLIAELLIRFDYRAAGRRVLRSMAGSAGRKHRRSNKMPTRKAGVRASNGAVLTMPRIVSTD